MSRWINAFENHQFHNTWNTVKEEVNKIDETEITEDNQLLDVARLNKTIEYINEYLKLVDPDINITNVIQNLKHMNDYAVNLRNELINYNSSKSITYIQNANSHIDNILGQLRALTIYIPKTTGQSIVGMLKKYNNTLDLALKEIDLNSVIADAKQIKEYKNDLLVDEENISIYTQIKKAYSDIEEKQQAIKEFYDNTLNDSEYNDTLKELVQNAKNEVVEANNTAKNELTELTNKIEKFEEYYVKIFGELNEEEVRTGGLKKEIEIQKANLDDFEEEQQKRHNKMLEDKIDELDKYLEETQSHNKNLHTQIESLLPGATSAGLAEAYHKEREKFKEPIENWNKLFIISLGVMFIATFLSFITITSTDTSWNLAFSQVKSYEDTVNNLFFKLPLYGPLIWLAIYASKRRSENQRLEQEYAHKEALARSYSGYKQQIEGLNQEDETLLKKLLDSSIDTVSKNASETLDKKHGDGTPSKEVLENIGNSVKKALGK